MGIRSFASFATDAYYGDMDHSVTRAADGTTLSYMFNAEGVDGRFLVRADAAAFDDDGSFSIDMDFEPSRGSRGQTFIAFAPAVDDPGPGPNPIPLPPAAWAAMATASAFGAGGKAGGSAGGRIKSSGWLWAPKSPRPPRGRQIELIHKCGQGRRESPLPFLFDSAFLGAPSSRFTPREGRSSCGRRR